MITRIAIGLLIALFSTLSTQAEPLSLPKNLAADATITATSEFDAERSAQHVADGKIPDEGSRSDIGEAWVVHGKSADDSAELTLSWDEPVELAELVYFGRTAFGSTECWRDYEVYFDEATDPTVQGSFESLHGPQRITFEKRTVRKVRFHFLNSHKGMNPGASEILALAEPLDEALFGRLLGYPELSGPAPSGPNVILFIADDVSVDDFGCYGHPTIRTPSIDHLAAGGIRFTNAYLTCSQCSPTRCSVLSSRYPHNNGAPELHMELPGDQPMFAAELKKVGYWCVQAGKWHMGEPAKAAFHRVWEGRGGGPGNEGRWVDCLRQRPKDRPFFAWFASSDAHRTWQPDEDARPHTREEVVVPPYLVDDAATRDDLRQYYDEIQRYDRFIGLCVEELDRQGELDNTLIIVMADNGRPFPRCKTRLYDCGLKTPFVVSYPSRVKQATVCDSLVSVIDIGPTILDLANVSTPAAMQGLSFLPLLDDPTSTTRRYVFGEHNWHDFKAHERSCHDGRYLYIRNRLPELPASQPGQAMAAGGAYQSLFAGFKAGSLTEPQQATFLEPRAFEELYDTQADYHQLTNLADAPEMGPVLRRMRDLLDQWTEATGDTFPADLTEDVCDRHNANALIPQSNGQMSMRPWRRGTMPGEERDATSILEPGPR